MLHDNWNKFPNLPTGATEPQWLKAGSLDQNTTFPDFHLLEGKLQVTQNLSHITSLLVVKKLSPPTKQKSSLNIWHSK